LIERIRYTGKHSVTSDEGDFKFLLEKIHRNTGADFGLYRTGTLKRRIASRLRTAGCRGYSDYIIYLNKEPEEYAKLIDAITINVTEFFRNPETFHVIEKSVVPEIIRAKKTQGRKVIRAWSAGTSFGEEAYSLAILFLEALGEHAHGFDIIVYGTDIDPGCIVRAKAGLYSQGSMKEVKKDLVNKYFHKSDGLYAVNDSVRNITNFKLHNLVSDEFLPHMDLILCRNVVIYFTKPLQEMVYSGFARTLNKDGFLVLGKVESLWGYPKEQFKVFDNRERIYRKR